jgi:hypothetical protein
MDAWVTWFLDTFMTEIDAVVTAMNLNSTNSTSVTSLAIGTGSKTLTVGTAKSYVIGMTVKIAYTTDGSKWMLGEVTAYNSGTGSMTVAVRTINSTGTFAAWTVSMAATTINVGEHIVTVHSGNGHGSTNTKRRRFTTTKESTGTAITYADSATLGASFTINEDGHYEIYYYDSQTAGGATFGVTLNNAQPTTAITVVTGNDRLLIGTAPSSNAPSPVTRIIKLVSTDVIYAHTDGLCNTTTEGTAYFSIRKVSNG